MEPKALLTTLARKGALVRLDEIAAEVRATKAVLLALDEAAPVGRKRMAKAAYRAKAAAASGRVTPLGKRTPAQRLAQSRRMKAYWRKRKAASGGR